MSSSFKIRQHIFPVRTKIFLGEASLLPGVMVTSDHNMTGSENGENSSETTLKK